VKQIVWDDSFSVGVTVLDTQHHRIIDMINLLLSEPDADVTSETLSDILTLITTYSREHFETEEGLLEQYGYPDLPAHREQHVSFRESAGAFCVATMGGHAAVPEHVLRYLKEWWTHHILTTDMQYRPFFREKGIA